MTVDGEYAHKPWDPVSSSPDDCPGSLEAQVVLFRWTAHHLALRISPFHFIHDMLGYVTFKNPTRAGILDTPSLKSGI